MTVGLALWPEQLDDQERAWLHPGVPQHLDRRPDVLVVGGGIVGLATAVACTQAGLGSVVLLERDRLAAGPSGGAAGLLVPEAHVGVEPPFLVDLMRLSLAAWRNLERTWPHGVGLQPMDWLDLEPAAVKLQTQLLGAEPLTAEQVDAMLPGLSQPGRGVLVRDQARVNPLRAAARMAGGLACVASGVHVQGISTVAGRVQAVHTTAGEVRPGNVVFATGMPPRIDGLNLQVPSEEVKGHMLATEPTSHRLPGTVVPLATSIDEGRLLIGGTLDLGDSERVVRPEVIAAMWADVEVAWPLARGVRVAIQWACFRPAHPDRLPVIDRVPGLTNAWLSSGHYRTGILLAPATGLALADWIRSGERPAQVDGLGVARFTKR